MPVKMSVEKAKTVREIYEKYSAKYPLYSLAQLAKAAVSEIPKPPYTHEGLRKAFKVIQETKVAEDQHQKQSGFTLPKSLYTHPAVFEIPANIKTIGVLNDIHIPFHDLLPLETALNYLRYRNVDCILLNGDIIDCYAESRWLKNPKLRNMKNEIESTKQFFEELRRKFRKALLLYKFGNHEERHEHYIWQNAYELWEMEQVTLDELLGCRRLGIEVIKDKRRITAGKLNILHGHEIRTGGTVNIGRSALLKTFDNILFGHFHRTQDVLQPKLDDGILGAFSVGALCGMHPEYLPVNSWNSGFAIVEMDRDGYFSVENLRIINGRVK